MKIIGIGRNYANHAKELGNEVPTEPVVFLKPDTALLRNNDDFYYPNYSNDIHHEIELVVRICREGTNIEERFAHKHYDQLGLGIDFTARDLQKAAKEKGLPWDMAKGFNHSAPISKFIPIEEITNHNAVDIRLDINKSTVQSGNTKDMSFSIDQLIVYVSKFFLLKKGDYIYTGTPEGVGPVKIGDHLEGYLNNQKMLDFQIK